MRQLKISKSITSRESHALDRYLTEIGREDLLSLDDEIELSQRIRKGDREALDRAAFERFGPHWHNFSI